MIIAGNVGCFCSNHYIRAMIKAFKEFLSRWPGLTEEDIAFISSFGELRNYDKKVIVTNIGEQENYIHLVLHGLARKFFYAGKKEIITQIAKENEFINSSVSFITSKPSEYIIETIEPSVFISFTQEHLEILMNSNLKYKKVIRMILMQLLIEKEKWEIERVELNTRERFANFIKTNSELFRRVPQKYLASYLNIQPETFSRLKHTLKKAY